ncbi:IPTL-CTERM sorting domain-containing protein [Ottowia sp. VDI28]|uniref:IPTL-CTERM sorting domain-containing protein n=1 Tax=Ottowia sp. VDI28 TaxID=3133968 RepID=UPI003C3072F4
MRSLLLGGLLSANCVWAGTWNITFTPQQTLDTPPVPVFSFAPPSGARFGSVVRCTGGDITFDPANGVFQLPFSDASQAFVAFENIYASPSSVAVTVTPSGSADAVCALDALPTVYTYNAADVDAGSATQSFSSTLHEGYVRLIDVAYDPATGYSVNSALPASSGSFTSDFFQADPNFFDYTTAMPGTAGAAQASIAASGTVSSNVFVNAKTTAATVAFELTSPQPTDSIITFTVEAVPKTYPGSNGNYDPVALGYEPTYSTPTTVTVTIPAGSTTVSVTIPGILPGSEVAITPVSHPGSVVGTPVLVKTSPLPVATLSQTPIPLTNVVATPGEPGPFTETVPTNVIDFKVTLDVPTVIPPTTPQAVPTLGEWSLGLLGALIAGFAALRRRSFASRS